MTSLIDQIFTVTTNRPTEQQLVEPRRYRRRTTWVPVVGEKVTVWRMSSYDPDRELAYPGIFLGQDDNDYSLQVDDHETPQKFRKRDSHGAIRWRLDARGFSA
jgi:hypothetical protein